MRNPEIDQLPLIDEAVIAELRDVMEENFADLIHGFLNDMPVQLGLLQAAVDQQDADQLYRAAHKFKSSCSSIGAPRLAELIRRLEQAGRQQVLDGAPALLAHAPTVAAETADGLHNRLG